MSYSNIKKKLESGQVIILDGAIGGELEKVGAPMDKNLWVGKCSNAVSYTHLTLPTKA